ncbi:N-acetylneuraminate synthase family protein [Insolitispirillum peregrinum]|uniref:N-acetylneuraminate synthase n=1 Tax=Insolitispirillum peregrinum TaxID=80876 RepID=A0A1N7JD51_9PROT|nr:N-acetylneuraminate synthase family protein [Insolitispirillum peregrinum]SIS47248.1 N-acetylneuraminate synthase [Insolitispirillum peregrinum]
MVAQMKIGSRLIGDGHPVFVMAEAGANHNGDLGLAKQLVDVAKAAGADCVKFQTFTAAEFCADRTKTFTYFSQGQQVTESEYEMFRRLEFTREEWVELMAYCDQQQIMFLTTVQDPVNLEMMQDLGLLAIKVGSDDFDHLPNLRTFADTGLPLIISKGMADADEVDKVVNDLKPRCSSLGVLHCVSLYPSDPEHLNLAQIPALRARHPEVVWGFSDHSRSTVAPALAVALGARIIEKHITLSHDLPGPDHWFSMDPAELTEMVAHIRFAEAAQGSGLIIPNAAEERSRTIMRRRIIARHDLPAGTVLDEQAVTFKRAEQGLYVGDWDSVQGHRLRTAKAAAEGICADDLEPAGV